AVLPRVHSGGADVVLCLVQETYQRIRRSLLRPWFTQGRQHRIHLYRIQISKGFLITTARLRVQRIQSVAINLLSLSWRLLDEEIEKLRHTSVERARSRLPGGHKRARQLLQS